MTTILAFLIYSFVVLLSKLTRKSLESSQRVCEKPAKRVCPTCSSEHLIKNGSAHNNKPKYQCKGCDRQFVVNPTKTSIPKELKLLIDRLLLERISLRGIARVTQVSWSWLQDYVNQKRVRSKVVGGNQQVRLEAAGEKDLLFYPVPQAACPLHQLLKGKGI